MLLPPLLPLQLPPLVDAVVEEVVVAEAAVDQAVVVGVASTGAGERSAVATVAVEGDEGKAGDDAMLLESGGKLGSALWLLLTLLLSLLLSRVLILLWSVLSCTMDEAILLRLLLKLPDAAAVLSLLSPPPPELPSGNCPNVGDMGEVGDIVIMAAIETPCGPGDVGDRGGNAALAMARLLLLVVPSEGEAPEAAGVGGGEK